MSYEDGVKVSTVHGEVQDRVEVGLLVKHLPCQHQDLNLPSKIQVRNAGEVAHTDSEWCA